MDPGATLHGREAETARLRTLVAEAAAGTGRAVVLRGDAGIGKSRLLATLADEAEATGFVLRAARGDELGQGRPFGPIAQALGLRPDAEDPAAAAVGRILAGQDELDHSGLPLAGEVRFRVLDTVLALVDEATTRAPLALVVDDVHWADDDSLRVLAALAERSADRPLLLAVGTRGHPLGPALTAALRALGDAGADTIDLEPLDGAAMAAVVAELVGGRPGPRLAGEVARAGGNPFLVIELVTALSAGGALVHDGGNVELAADRPALDLGDAALRRLDHLGPRTVELLRAASVLGRTFDLPVVADVLGRRGVEVAADVDEALAAGLLQPAGARLSFAHDLVREGIYDQLPVAVRTTLHVEAAKALAANHAEAFDIAAQVERSTSGAGAEAVDWLRQGADQVRVTAPATAAGFLVRAAELLDPADPRSLDVQARLAEALVFSGRQVEGQALAEQCLARDDLAVDDRRALTYLLGQALFLQGRLTDAARQFEHGTDEDDPNRPAALADGALALLLSGELAEAATLAERALTAAQADGDAGVETFVLALLSWVHGLQGDLTEALELGRRAVARADGSGTLEAHRNVPYVFYAQVLLWADRDREAMAAIERARDLGERLGLVWDVPLRHLLAARAAHRAGDWDEAVAEAHAGLSHSRDQGGSVAEVWLWCVLARIAVARGERDETERCLREAEAHEGGQGGDQIAWARGLLAEAADELDAADLYLGLLWDGLESRGLDYYVWDIAPDVVRVALRRGDRDRVDRVLAALAEISERSWDSSAPVVEARCRGMADQDADAYLLALDRQRARKADARPVELALLQAEAADVLDAAGRSGDAAALRAAAAPVLAAARAVPLGVPGVAAAPADAGAATFGWASLTPRELEVIDLLAESLSNAEIAERLICSRRTVESHLSHAYTKLGISSRVELAVLAADRRRD